jgi:hypothetical protein
MANPSDPQTRDAHFWTIFTVMTGTIVGICFALIMAAFKLKWWDGFRDPWGRTRQIRSWPQRDSESSPWAPRETARESTSHRPTQPLPPPYSLHATLPIEVPCRRLLNQHQDLPAQSANPQVSGNIYSLMILPPPPPTYVSTTKPLKKYVSRLPVPSRRGSASATMKRSQRPRPRKPHLGPDGSMPFGFRSGGR